MKTFSYVKGVICTFLLLISNSVFADWTDISSNIEITKSRPAFDRVNRVYFVHLDVKNTGGSILNGPFRILIDNSTIPVTRQSGNTESGIPFVEIATESITTNETVRVRVDFLAQRKALTFDAVMQSEVLLLEGRFIDSSVSGIEYLTSSGHSGFTGINGEFIFEPGDRVEFFLGGHSIGSSNGKSIITPVDLFSDVIDKNEKHNKVASLAVLLQSADEDQNPSNGIVISTDMYNEARILEKEITTFVHVNEEEQIGVLAKMGVPYISKGTAIGHLNSTLQEYDIDETCYHSEDSYYFGTFTTPAKYCKARTRRYNFYYKDIPILNGLSKYHYDVAAGAAASAEDALKASATMIDSILYAQITTDATYLRLADKKARKNYIKKKAKGWIKTAIQKSLTTTGNLILNDQTEEAILSYSVTMIGDYIDAPSCVSGDKSACVGILFNQLRNGFDFFVASFGSIIIDNHLEKGNEYTIVKELMTQYYNYHHSWEKYAQEHCTSTNERDSQVCNIDFITEDSPLPDGWEKIIIHVASKSGMCGNEHGCEKVYDFSVAEVSKIFVERLEFLRTIEDIPLLTTPQSLSVEVKSDSLNLEWDHVNSAISYIVSWKTGANFSSTRIERNISNTSFILNRELIENDEKVYFQVQAVGEEGDISELSETIVFDSLLDDVTKLEDFLTGIVILDSNFMTCITDSIGKYNWKSILDVNQLNCSGYGIENIVGINSFPNLTTINFDNNNIKSAALSRNNKLVSVSFVNNPLSQQSIDHLVRQYYPYLLLSNEMDVSVNITVVGVTDSIKLRVKSDYEEAILEINADGQYSTGKVFRKYSYWNADINWTAELVRTPDNHNCEFDTELGQFLTETTEITITCSEPTEPPAIVSLFEGDNYHIQSNQDAYSFHDGTHYIVWSNGVYSTNSLYNQYDREVKLSKSIDGINWQTSVVANTVYGSFNHKLAVANNGDIHVVYVETVVPGTYSGQNRRLVYANNTSGAFQTTTIENGSSYRYHSPSKLFFTPDGMLNLFYQKSGWWRYNAPLYERTFDGANWSSASVVSNLSFGRGDPDDDENKLLAYEIVDGKKVLYVSSGYWHLAYHGAIEYSGHIFKYTQSGTGYVREQLPYIGTFFDIDSNEIVYASKDRKSIYFNDEKIHEFTNDEEIRSVNYDITSGYVAFNTGDAGYAININNSSNHLEQYNDEYLFVKNGMLMRIKWKSNPKRFTITPLRY